MKTITELLREDKHVSKEFVDALINNPEVIDRTAELVIEDLDTGEREKRR